MKKTVVLFLFATLAQIILLPSAFAQLSTQQEREIIFDCTQLVNDYAYYRDLRDPEKFADLFTEDARMTVRGQWIGGREALEQHILDDDPNEFTMHIITTVKITPIDENNATGVAYAAVAHGSKGEQPAMLESFDVIGKYFDKYVNTDDGWKISERVFNVIFMKPGA